MEPSFNLQLKRGLFIINFNSLKEKEKLFRLVESDEITIISNVNIVKTIKIENTNENIKKCIEKKIVFFLFKKPTRINR